MELIRRVYCALGWDEEVPPPLSHPNQTLCDHWTQHGLVEANTRSTSDDRETVEMVVILDRAMTALLRVHDYRTHPTQIELRDDEELIVFKDDPRGIALALRVANAWSKKNPKKNKKL